MLDLLLKGGTVIDGTGDARITGDVGVRDGLVTRIGQIFEDAERTLDVSGLVVCPGFIDVHTHYDVQLLWTRRRTPPCSTESRRCSVGIAGSPLHRSAQATPATSRG